MPIYNDVFGGANIYPSEISYSAITLTTTDVTLSWPEETSTNVNLATRIIDVTATVAGRSIFLPDAQKSGVGNTILFNNQGAETFIVKNAGGTQIVSIAAGTVWQVYLTSNTTANGLWETLQFGATVSVANASALAGTGIVAVGSLLSQSVPITQFNSNYTAGAADRAKMYLWTSSGSGVLTLPSAATVGNDWFMYLRNSGGGQVTLTPSGINTIDGLATKAYQPTESSVIISDGSNFYTLGFGQASVFVFDYTVISIAGTGDYTLSGSELNRIVYKFTGALTGNRNVIVPATVQQYWVDNSTTGSYTLTVKTSAGTGVAVTQGARGIYYCNGTDVVNSDTRTASYPITVAQGGTGATNAGAALINLGGTSVGTAIFTASDQAAAWSALGVAPAGVVVGGTF
jgi:hypothetical protein